MAKIKEIGRVVTGKTPSTKKEEYWENGKIRFITPSDLLDGYVVTSTNRFITEKGYRAISSNALSDLSVLVGCIGSDLGNVAISNGHCATNQQINAITDFNSGINPYYVYYWLSHKKTYLQQIAGATTTPILCKSDFENIEIPVPSKVTQNNIANVLKNIDDIVFNNNKIIKELESLASDFYDYWFVQFDFPDENGKPYKSSGGKMVWNEDLKREIPEGWKIESILDYCDIIDCLHSKKPNYHFISDSSYLLTLDNLTKNGHIDVSNKYYISDSDYKKWTSNIEVKENDFVVTNAGRAGDICKIPQNVKCAIGRNITAIRPKNISPYYLQQYFKSPDMQYQVKTHLDSGSFFMSFNVKSIKVIKILVPSQKIIIQAENILKTYSIAIDNLIEENFELSSLRDFLLPLLMNGQVGFKDEERITGRNS